MKNKHLYISILSLGIAALAFTGCNTETIVEEYVQLETATADFKGAGNEPITINVSANPKFTVKVDKEVDEKWIIVSDTTATSFKVKAEDNDTGLYRSGTITITAGGATQQLTVYQTMQDNGKSIFRKMRYSENAMSPNCKYAGGFTLVTTDKGESKYEVSVVEVATDKRFVFDLIDPTETQLRFCYAISDQGKLFIDGPTGQVYIFDITTMDRTNLGAIIDTKSNAKVNRTSADGNTWVGTCVFPGADGGITWPMIWENQEPRKLDRPDKSFRGGDPWYGAMARACSADGSVIYGTSWEGYDTALIWWKNGELQGYAGGTDVDTGDQIHFISDQEAEIDLYPQFLTNGLRLQDQNSNISPNGKYIATMYTVEVTTPGGVEPGTYPAFFNTETNKTKVFTELGGCGFSVNDAGIGFTTDSSLGIANGTVVNVETGEILGKADEWIRANFGLSVPAGPIVTTNANSTIVYGVSTETNAMGSFTVNWYVAPAITH